MTSHKTPLYECHLSSGAHMMDFHGTWLPVRYESERLEHQAVRHSAGIFDVSHMGELLIEGHDAERFLMKMLTTDVAQLSPGRAHYSLMLHEHGGIIDDLVVYRLSASRFLLCVNAGNITADLTWLQKHLEGSVTITDASPTWAQIALQGPMSPSILRSHNIDFPPPFAFYETSEDPMIIAHTGYTGETGVEIFLSHESAIPIWQRLVDAGAKPCGLAARDSLRLEAGMRLCGTDMDHNTTPWQARLGFAVNMVKGDFIGRERLELQTTVGLDTILIGFVMSERGIPRQGIKILNADEQEIGSVTSAAWPEEHAFAFGIGYVKPYYANVGHQIKLAIRNRLFDAIITKPKFLRNCLKNAN